MYKSSYNKASSRIAKRRKAREFFGIFIKTFFTIAVFAAIFFVLQADFLQVKNFEVSGTKILSSEEISGFASNFISGNKLLIIPKSNILFLSKEKLSSEILKKFPRLRAVDINKNFFRSSVSLSVSERQADFLWCSLSDECFSMSNDGLIFEKISDPLVALSGKIVFKGNVEGDPIMKNFVSPEIMKNYSDFIKTLNAGGIETDMIRIESQDKAIAKTGIGEIFFNPRETDLSSAAANAILIINDTKAQNPSAVFEYIDIRFGNKIFYKLI